MSYGYNYNYTYPIQQSSLLNPSQIFGANLKLWLDANDAATITKTNTKYITGIDTFYRNADTAYSVAVDNGFYRLSELPSGAARPSYTNGNPTILSGNMAMTPVIFRYKAGSNYARYCRFVTGVTYLTSYTGVYSIAEFDFVNKVATGGNCTIDFTEPGDGYTYATVYPTITSKREKVINRYTTGTTYVQSCEVNDNGIFDGHSYVNSGKIFEIKNDFSLTNIAQENVSEWKNKALLTEKFVKYGSRPLPWYITLSNGKKAVKSWSAAKIASGLTGDAALEHLYIVGGTFLNWDNAYSQNNTWGYTAKFSAGNEAILYGNTNVVMPFPLGGGVNKYRSARSVNRDTLLASFSPGTYQVAFGQRQIGFRQFWTDNTLSYGFDGTEAVIDVSLATETYLPFAVTAWVDVEITTVFVALAPVPSAKTVVDMRNYLQSKKGEV